MGADLEVERDRNSQEDEKSILPVLSSSCELQIQAATTEARPSYSGCSQTWENSSDCSSTAERRWERRPGPMTIAELVETLGTVNAPEAAVPLALLRPFMRGGLFEGFFDRPKALLSPHFPAGQWWNFDLSSLREENRAIVHAVLAWFLYHAVTVGKQPMDIFIDEGWRLLRSGPFTDLLDELGRRARKRGVGVTLITHLPADLMKNPTSLSLASTSFIGSFLRSSATA